MACGCKNKQNQDTTLTQNQINPDEGPVNPDENIIITINDSIKDKIRKTIEKYYTNNVVK